VRFYIVNILGHLTFENLWQDENAARYMLRIAKEAELANGQRHS
jgi:hypothetical protein